MLVRYPFLAVPCAALRSFIRGDSEKWKEVRMGEASGVNGVS